MCTNPITIHRMVAGRFVEDTVPCGKCEECLKKKRSALGVMSYRTAEKYGNMVFVTYTYRDDSLPLAFDYSRSKLIVSPFENPDHLFDIDLRSLYFSQDFDWYVDSKGKKHRVHKKVDVPFLDFMFTLCPTLCRRDWRLSLKRSRVRYERKFGESLPEFKVFMCGEYSPICHRPHYHAVFYGLTYSQVNFLCEDWRKNFGFTQICKVRNLNSHSDGRLACSMYVGKYVFKGSCEYENVLNGFCEKPRRISSKNFGVPEDISPDLLGHHLAFDIYQYNPSCPKFPDLETLNKVCSIIYSRLCYGINNRKYSLPERLKKSLFFSKEKKVDGSTVFRELPIWSLVKTFVRNKSFKDFEDFSRSCVRKPLSEVFVQEASFLVRQYEDSKHASLQTLQEDYLNFLRISKVL